MDHTRFFSWSAAAVPQRLTLSGLGVFSTRAGDHCERVGRKHLWNHLGISLFSASLLLVAGCSLSHGSPAVTLSTSTPGPLQGRVRGGQQPIGGAHVYLYATGSMGDGGKDIAPVSGNASVSLLGSAANTSSDGTNYYVTTDSGGGFTITGDYTCTPGSQVYLYAVGGNPGGGINAAAGLLAGVGACPAGATTLPPTAYFWVNELTTVATAYALAGFASDPTHISANTAVSNNPAAQLQATALANAMANVSNLVNIGNGTALATTPGGNGSVPQAELDTLGNILAACINSTGRSSSNCATLLSTELSDGSTGASPTDTAAAAINIAHNAGQNIATLYGLQPGTGAVFLPDLTTQPDDFAIAIAFAGGGTSSPQSVSVDSLGNVWGVSTGDVVNLFSPLGVPLPSTGNASATTAALASLVLDTRGNAWAIDTAGNYTELTASGGSVFTRASAAGGDAGSSATTSDSFGYLWSADSSDGTVSRFDPANHLVVSKYTIDSGSLLAADTAGFVWLAASDGTLYKFTQAGVIAASYPSLYTSGTALSTDSTDAAYVDDSSNATIRRVGSDGSSSSFPDGVGGGTALAVDGGNNLWSANTLIAQHTSGGTLISGVGFHLPGGTATTSIAIDSAGNLWAAATTENKQPGSHYLEYIGLAPPAMTPLAYANTHGTLQNAQNLTIGFNGPDVQFPYIDQIYSAMNASYQSIGSSYPAGARYCHAYLSWDIAQQAVGSGPLATEGSRSWFEDWLQHAQGHCDRALVTFKYVSGVTQTGSYPSAASYETAMTTFLNTSWAYTGWTGVMDFTAWNEPQNGAGSGDGLTVVIPAETAADYYLALRKHCVPGMCRVAAGDFGSNGSLDTSYFQDCASDAAPTLCTGASYMDQYKHWIITDAPGYGFSATFIPELFAYHGWDDVNNYINSGSHCTDPQKCTIRALNTALSDPAFLVPEIWDTEVAAGQNPQSNPTPIVQACAAAYLLDLTASVTNRITRLYYTQPYVAAGNYFSLFDSTATPKPAFSVIADHSITYTPPSGSTCP
jgi:hypothetical protein